MPNDARALDTNQVAQLDAFLGKTDVVYLVSMPGSQKSPTVIREGFFAPASNQVLPNTPWRFDMGVYDAPQGTKGKEPVKEPPFVVECRSTTTSYGQFEIRVRETKGCEGEAIRVWRPPGQFGTSGRLPGRLTAPLMGRQAPHWGGDAYPIRIAMKDVIVRADGISLPTTFSRVPRTLRAFVSQEENVVLTKSTVTLGDACCAVAFALGCCICTLGSSILCPYRCSTVEDMHETIEFVSTTAPAQIVARATLSTCRLRDEGGPMNYTVKNDHGYSYALNLTGFDVPRKRQALALVLADLGNDFGAPVYEEHHVGTGGGGA